MTKAEKALIDAAIRQSPIHGTNDPMERCICELCVATRVVVSERLEPARRVLRERKKARKK